MLDVHEPKINQIGATVRLGLTSPELPREAVARIKQLVYQHKLVVLQRLKFTCQEYVRFARNFGTPQVYFQPNYHHPEHPEIFVSSNQEYNGAKFGVAGTGRYWHTDYQFFEQPLPLTMVYPQVFAPSARHTSYIDMVRVLHELPPALAAKLEGKRARHEATLRYKVQATDIDRSIAELIEEVKQLAPPVFHPSIVEHPVTGERILYMSPGFTVGLDGLDHESNRQLLGELFEFVTRPDHVHTHTWDEGEILLWDNRVLLHRASDNLERQASVSFRIGIYDGLPFYRGLEPWSEQTHV